MGPPGTSSSYSTSIVRGGRERADGQGYNKLTKIEQLIHDMKIEETGHGHGMAHGKPEFSHHA
jgi:hypothetical protein